MKALIPTLALLILNLVEGKGAPTKYKSSGYGADTSINWSEPDCDYGSYFSLYASEYVQKVKADGKPETTKNPSIYTYYSRWYDCSAESVTHTYLQMDYENDTPSTSVTNKKLERVSVSSTFGAFLVTEICDIKCYTDEYDGETWTYCEPVCPEHYPEKVKVTLQATFVGTGGTYTSKSTYSDRHPDGSFYRSKSSRRSRDATVSPIAFTVDGNGTPIDIPSDAEKYASIYTSTDGSISVYRNGN
jgi:hypothetical protein